MKKVINNFDKEYRYLSNFANIPVVYNGFVCTCAESAFQMMKTNDLNKRYEIANSSASDAKRIGRNLKLREDWEEVKDNIMYEIVKAKFSQNPKYLNKLCKTEDTQLIEGNTWGDKYWGICNNEGQNKLGIILMKVREELRPLNNQYIREEIFTELKKLSKIYSNQRIGQIIFNYICSRCPRNDCFYINDEDLLKLIKEALKDAKRKRY